jgi:methylated-DNA-[protein]-cysteine S-methyltransferase
MDNRALPLLGYSGYMKIHKDTWVAFKTPIGIVRVYAQNEKVTFIDIAAKDAMVGSAGKADVLKTAEKELTQYFSGKLTKFTFPVDLSSGTEFQRSVWKQISRIPFGKLKTYKDIADAIGKPKAARAVGGAVGSNPVPLVVGCHRVLGASGKITGYSGGDGLPTKRWLLAHEGLTAKE